MLPDSALAHGLVGRQDLPIPRWMFAWGAAIVLIISFVALAALWPQPRLQDPAARRVLRVPRALDPLCGMIGLAIFAVVVYSGFAGTQTATANLAPTFVYVIFWVGIPVVSLFLGDVFKPFNPWRALARAVAWLASRLRSDPAPDTVPYPDRLGYWPAAVGVLAFTWVELAYSHRDDPSTLAALALAYAAVQLIGMSLYGIDAWERRGDGFAVYFRFVASLAPLVWRDGELQLRKPLAGAPSLAVLPGIVALLCVLIGSTSFDGFSQGELWNDIAPDLQQVFVDVGLSSQRAVEAAFTVGLIGAILFVAGVYRLGVLGMRSVERGHSARELGESFAHSLVPIALAYVVAHYFSLLVYQGQAMAYLVSDPLGDGSDLFGTASSSIDYGVITATGIWYVQVGALVIGHACALTLAHDRALVIYERAREATRSQYWMLAVMIGFTSLGLWLLSAQAQ